jgi:hypothetical protein
MPTSNLEDITADNFLVSIGDSNITTATATLTVSSDCSDSIVTSNCSSSTGTLSYGGNLIGWYEGTPITVDHTIQTGDVIIGQNSYWDHSWGRWTPANATLDFSIANNNENNYEKCTSFRFKTRRKRITLTFKF